MKFAKDLVNEQAGIIYYGLGRYKLAVINLRKVVEENPRYAEAHYLLGLAYDKENQTQLALKQFDEASMIDPKETKYLFASGKLNMKNGRHKQAMAKFQKILNIDPNSAEGYLYLARCCKEMFRPDLAMQMYEKAVSIRLDYIAAWMEFGQIASQLGDWDRATKAISKAVDLDPNDYEAYFNLSQAVFYKCFLIF